MLIRRILSASARALFLAFFVFGVTCTAAVTPVTVLLDFETASPTIQLPAVQSELRTLLSPSHLEVKVLLRGDLPPNSQAGLIVAFHMNGDCSTASDLPIDALSDERGPLAMSYSSDGQILPFGEVECNRLRQVLSRMRNEQRFLHAREFNLALARVLAHEIYHMVGQTPDHTESGTTKAALSARELTGPTLPIDNSAQKTITDREATR